MHRVKLQWLCYSQSRLAAERSGDGMTFASTAFVCPAKSETLGELGPTSTRFRSSLSFLDSHLHLPTSHQQKQPWDSSLPTLLPSNSNLSRHLLGVHTAFWVPNPTTLVLKEKAFSWSGDDFQVKDANGVEVIRVKGKTLGFGGEFARSCARGVVPFQRS